MKTVILYHSQMGSTKKFAEQKAKELSCEIEEIKGVKKLNPFFGGFKAKKRKSVPIQKINANLQGYDKIIVMSPTWHDSPTPPINALFEQLPQGKELDLIMVSASGKTSDESVAKTKQVLSGMGLSLHDYGNIGSKPKK